MHIHTYICMTNDNDFTQSCPVVIIFVVESEGDVSTCQCTRHVDCRSSSHGAVVTSTLCVIINVGTAANGHGEYTALLGAWNYT